MTVTNPNGVASPRPDLGKRARPAWRPTRTGRRRQQAARHAAAKLKQYHSGRRGPRPASGAVFL